MEMDEQAIDLIIKHCSGDIEDGRHIQSSNTFKEQSSLHDAYDALATLLDNWLSLADSNVSNDRKALTAG